MKKTILLATSAIVAAGFAAADASAVDVDMYGQVNKAVMLYDDGRDSETNFVDNDKSNTRMGVRGSQTLDNGLTASVLLEWALENNSSNLITQNTAGSIQSTDITDNPDAITTRHARVGIAGDFGAVFLGKTSTATDGITEIDMAGVDDLMGSGMDRFGGALQFRNSAGAVTGQTVAGGWDNMDGIVAGSHNDRVDGISYHSPVYNGFQARVSTVQGGSVDGAVRYSGKVDAFEVKAGVGYVAFQTAAHTATDTPEDQMSGSVSVKHDSGLAGTFAYGQRDLANKTTGTDDPTMWYAKVGYGWDAFSVAADWGVTEDLVTGGTDSELSAYGVGAQYDMGSGVSAAVAYRQFDFDDNTATNFDEMNMWLANMRVKF